MSKKKVDQKLIASNQAYELKYICSVWFGEEGKHLSMDVLKVVVKKIGRSRRAVYAVLKYLGYSYRQPKKKK
jgi:transposase